MLYSHFTQNCIFLYFLEAKNPCFVTKNCWKSSYICVFILSKKQRNWFYKNLHNSGMVGRKKLPYPSLNRIFNALSISVQYTLSCQWFNFGLKCLQESRNQKYPPLSFAQNLKTGESWGYQIWYVIKFNKLLIVSNKILLNAAKCWLQLLPFLSY